MLADSPNTHAIVAKGDSAATNHYLIESDATCLKNIKPNHLVNVTLPNSVAMSLNKQGELPLSDDASVKGKTTLALLDLTSSSLVSLGQLCNDGCNEEKLSARKDKDLIIEEVRNKTDSL